jgi:uncharacterized protein YyaL (SSP411 family)
MTDLVPKIKQLWQSDRDKILQSAKQIIGHLEAASGASGGGTLDRSAVDTAYRQLRNRYDERDGGFGDHPKFPSTHNLIFLLRHWHHTGEPMALKMVERTLEAMRLGGIYDHIGFGFHRYSTDAEWLLPHFEKMLYDQAMLTLAYTEAYLATGKREYERTVREILAYVLRDMTSPKGGFYSAEDADSEGEEGKFYLWTVDEVRAALSDEQAEFAIDVFNLDPEGNFLDEATKRQTGTNIPHLRESHTEAAGRRELDSTAFDSRLHEIRRKLFDIREKRIHPLKDDKILTDWNGLMAAALARAGQVFRDDAYVTAASRAVDFVWITMRSEDGRLMHRYRDGSVSVEGFLDDYVFLTWACLELFDATHDPDLLARAIDLQEETDRRFWDETLGGYFFTSDDAEELLVRQKEAYDGAMPSGNSVAMANLVRLGRLTGRTDFSERGTAVAEAFADQASRMPSAHTHLIAALQFAAGPSLEIVIAGDPGAPDTARLLDVVHSRYLPQSVVLVVPDGDAGTSIRKLAPFAENYASIDGKAAAYVCRNYQCQLPTTDPDKLGELLDSAARTKPAS